MGITKFTSFNSQSPTVNAFLGGITFTALVLASQSHDTFKMSNFLIPLTAFASLLFIVATLSSMKQGGVHPYLFKFNVWLTTIGISILMVGVIPLIVYSFSFIGFIVVLFSAMILIGVNSFFSIISQNQPTNS